MNPSAEVVPFLFFENNSIQSINSLHKRMYGSFLASNADAIIDAGMEKVIVLHHAAGKDAGFDLFALSVTDSKTYSGVFVWIVHGKDHFIVGVAAGTVKLLQATFD